MFNTWFVDMIRRQEYVDRRFFRECHSRRCPVSAALPRISRSRARKCARYRISLQAVVYFIDQMANCFAFFLFFLVETVASQGDGSGSSVCPQACNCSSFPVVDCKHKGLSEVPLDLPDNLTHL